LEGLRIIWERNQAVKRVPSDEKTAAPAAIPELQARKSRR
jgi:hypothetical protein